MRLDTELWDLHYQDVDDAGNPVPLLPPAQLLASLAPPAESSLGYADHCENVVYRTAEPEVQMMFVAAAVFIFLPFVFERAFWLYELWQYRGGRHDS